MVAHNLFNEYKLVSVVPFVQKLPLYIFLLFESLVLCTFIGFVANSIVDYVSCWSWWPSLVRKLAIHSQHNWNCIKWPCVKELLGLNLHAVNTYFSKFLFNLWINEFHLRFCFSVLCTQQNSIYWLISNKWAACFCILKCKQLIWTDELLLTLLINFQN